MNVLVIDGQGGKLGKELCEGIKKAYPDLSLTAVGTNSIATLAMQKSGANAAATGENAIVVCSRKADVILGPIGIVIADSLLGEITPRAAAAVGQSGAKKILIPISKCNNLIAGLPDKSLSSLIGDAIDLLGKAINRGNNA